MTADDYMVETATATTAGSFTCQESGKQGFIRVDPNQHDFLKYDNGDTRLNIGENIAWNTGGIYGWNNYLVKLYNAGANWVRLWSCIYGSDYGVALEWEKGYGGKTYFQGAGKPSLPATKTSLNSGGVAASAPRASAKNTMPVFII